MELLSKKIALLNQTALDSLELKDDTAIIEKFTNTAIEMLQADFAFAWWKFGEKDTYELAYKSAKTPYTPKLPRKEGGNSQVQESLEPFYKYKVRKEDYEKGYDVSRYMKSYVIIPIHYNKHTYGNLVVCFKKEEKFLNEKQLICQVIGNSASQAITTHRLFQEGREKLRKSEELYRYLVELSPYAIFVQTEGKIVYLNSAGAKLLEASSTEEMLGKPILSIVHPDYHELALARMKASSQKKDNPLIEYKIVTLKGKVKNVEISAKAFNYEGKASSQAVILDVTKYKQTEEFFRTQKEELEQLNRILMKRELSSEGREQKLLAGALFDTDKSVLLIGDKQIFIQKFSKQYALLQVIFKDIESLGKDWQLSEISESMDAESEFVWKKLYNIADAIRKNIAIETGIKDFFILTTQSLKINTNYIKKS